MKKLISMQLINNDSLIKIIAVAKIKFVLGIIASSWLTLFEGKNLDTPDNEDLEDYTKTFHQFLPKPEQRSPIQLASGFTLLEIMIVLMMVGFLSVIAAPSWINFINQRQVNAVNSAVMSALREAQQEARMRKRRFSVSFQTDPTNQKPQVAFHLESEPPINWKPLGEGLDLKPGRIWLGTNLVGNNKTINGLSVVPSNPASTKPAVTFDFTGGLPKEANTRLKIVVALPLANYPTQPIDSSKRCVIVQTLLGSMRTGKEKSDCG